MLRVVIESPYSGDVSENERYARACLRDSLMRGEAPIASHLLHTQPGVLDDTVPSERRRGMEAGWAWTEVADLVAVYTDRGTSRGVHEGVRRAERCGVRVEYRKVPGWGS